MSPKIGVLIRKNSHEVIRVITNHYKVTAVIVNTRRPRNDYSTLSSIPVISELLWQHFQPVFLKLHLHQLGSNIPSRPQEVARKFSGLEKHSRTLHHTPTQRLCIHYSKINAPFSQNFRLNHKATRKHLPFAVG
jgi:hypothetical protein